MPENEHGIPEYARPHIDIDDIKKIPSVTDQLQSQLDAESLSKKQFQCFAIKCIDTDEWVELSYYDGHTMSTAKCPMLFGEKQDRLLDWAKQDTGTECKFVSVIIQELP